MDVGDIWELEELASLGDVAHDTVAKVVVLEIFTV
jgi:hypothetical protein